MKIVVTVANASEYYHLGGEVVRTSAIINIPDTDIPPILQKHFKLVEWHKNNPNSSLFESISFSLLDESVSAQAEKGDGK
jgi:hypothetical protein